MNFFGQYGVSSQLGHSDTQDIAGKVVFSGDVFNLRQQKLHQPWLLSPVSIISDYPRPYVHPYWRFYGYAFGPPYLNGNGYRYLSSHYANNQMQVFTPAGYGKAKKSCSPNLKHNDLTQPERPPYSYSALVALALNHSPEKMLTYSQICNYVVEKFPFYKDNPHDWQSRLKQRLTRDDFYKKVAREGGEECYWTLKHGCFMRLRHGKFMVQREKREEDYEGTPSKKLKKNNVKSDGLSESPASR